MQNNIITAKRVLKRLHDSQSGLAAVEFAVGLPFFLGLTVAGMETANYAATTMQLNQVTIHAADTAARMGEGSQLQVKVVKETHILDVFEGAKREGESLELNGMHAYTNPGTGVVSVRGNARMWLSSIEPVATFSTTNKKYRMRWQRCMGQANFFTPSYGTPATITNVDGVGPTGREIIAPPGGSVMFVETKYYYKPLLFSDISKIKEQSMSFFAAMVVRENRDTTTHAATAGIQQVAGVTPATC